MNDYKWIEGISSNKLSNNALLLVSRFSRVLKQTNGHSLSMQDPELTRSLVREYKQSNSPALHCLFSNLLIEFHAVVDR